LIRSCVVDANVGIKLFVAEELSEKAEALFRGLSADPPARLHVPDFFYLECSNILWKYVQHFSYSEGDARRNLPLLQALDLIKIATYPLLEASMDLALRQRITLYDACYAAVAQSLSIPLITDDRALIRRLGGSGIEVLWLGDLPG
jgi:predicted nucleic acid-binding protein